MVPNQTPAQHGRAHIQLYASDGNSPIRWRLLGGNNRELGRGSGEFVDVASCRASIDHLKAVLAELEQNVQRRGPNHWSWSLSLAGVRVATSSAQYPRLIRCRQALTQFIDQFGVCMVGTGVMLSHSRRWGTASGSALVEAGGRP